MQNLPFKFEGDLEGLSPVECLEWIKSNHADTFPDNLIPIWGESDDDPYNASCNILLFNPITFEFWSICGSHCSCYGYEGQFVPEFCPIEYIISNQYWVEAREVIEKILSTNIN